MITATAAATTTTTAAATTTATAAADARPSQHASRNPVKNTTPGAWTPCDRVLVRHTPYSVILENGFLKHSANHRDVEIRFRCRAPEAAPEVQVWAGFRARDRHHRYVVGLRGGNNDHLYLARYGTAGASRFLGIAPLEFSPETGAWYTLRVNLRGKRIRIFLGDEPTPRMDVEDDEAGWDEGAVVLGGGHLPAEYTDLEIRKPDTENSPAPPVPPAPPACKKKAKGYRHKPYRPARVDALADTRTEIPLDGTWLFQPAEENAPPPPPPLAPASAPTPAEAYPDHDDSAWHTIDVPALWTPFLTWLHGETTFNELDGVSRSKGISDKAWLAEMARVESYGIDHERTKTAWYRHHLHLPENIDGRRLELCFDAVAKACEIWFNGTQVGAHAGMFGEIRCDVSTAARPGANLLAVKVNRNPRHLTLKNDTIIGLAESVEVTQGMITSLPTDIICHDPAGIWQPVKLIITRAIFVRDVFVQPALDGARLDIEIGTHASGHHHRITISYTVRLRETGEILVIREKAAAGEAGALATLRLDLPKVSPLLWTPETPHLYDLEIRLSRDGRPAAPLDQHTTTFGFRTFGASGNHLLLNGKPCWLRGAGHFPHALRPNDPELARRFVQLAREGNVRATRFHVVPLTKTWAAETDRQGLLVSFEGIWPWLMLKGEPPARALLDIWHDDFAALVRKYRNHPSLVLWTINNEMKFYHFDHHDKALLRRKWTIVTRMIKTLRALDPTRPVVADSGYVRGQHREDYENIIRDATPPLDDGDVDDAHQYYAWYHPSFTTATRGQFARKISTPGRPLISQELATGYPRNDDGHPARFYLFKHGTPQALVGDYAYEHHDPRHFLERLAFTTKHTGEAIRRTNRDEAAGVMHFSYMTWFKNAHDAATLQPWTAPWQALRTTLQPILVSADFFGRHHYYGATLPLRLHLINDAADTTDLPPGTLQWAVIDATTGAPLTSDRQPTPPVPYYSNRTLHAQITMPRLHDLPGRCEARLRFRLIVDGTAVSENHYDITLASRPWARHAWTRPACRPAPAPETWLHDPAGLLRDVFAGIPQITPLRDFGALPSPLPPPPLPPPVVIIAGQGDELRENLSPLRHYTESGGRLLLLNTKKILCELLPEVVRAWRAVDGQIVNLHLPESPVFDGIDPLDLAWFHCGPGVTPTACDGVYQMVDDHNPDVTVLAGFCDFHNYLARPTDIVQHSGTPLFGCRVGQGYLLASEMTAPAASRDPVAARLVFNLLRHLTSENPSCHSNRRDPRQAIPIPVRNEVHSGSLASGVI
ncbi:MAG: hypothetical protein LBK99_19410 [Opitutaceae bacterium]|jgi:hypothetical protein|nr:hypothetical protein [Opitutaceae bacterium]